MKKRGRKKGGFFSTAALLFLFFIVAVVIVIYLGLDTKEVETPLKGMPEEKPTGVVPPPSVSLPEEVKPSYVVAIVIDDMGGDLETLGSLMETGVLVTVAVLPELRFSKDVARQAHEGGLEVLLHLPMEPKDTVRHDPGRGALFTDMDSQEIRQRIEVDIDEIPYVTGINNHMGSKFTEDARLMKIVLEVTKEKGLFFLDSKTSERSVTKRLAKELGIKMAERNVFLDNVRDKEYIMKQFEELLTIARKRGSAVGIGHPYPETIEVLKEMLPLLEGQGIGVTKVSELVG